MPLEGGIEQWSSLNLTHHTGRRQTIKLNASQIHYNDFATDMLSNFVDVVRGTAAPAVPASSVVHALELIEECYDQSTRMPLPWLDNLESLNDLANNRLTTSGHENE